MNYRCEYYTTLAGISSKSKSTQERMIQEEKARFEKLLKANVYLERYTGETYKVMVEREL